MKDDVVHVNFKLLTRVRLKRKTKRVYLRNFFFDVVFGQERGVGTGNVTLNAAGQCWVSVGKDGGDICHIDDNIKIPLVGAVFQGFEGLR